MLDYMLTTVDNPFNPFTQFDEWNAFDIGHGYGTCSFLARITRTSPELSDNAQALAIDDAMNEIIAENVSGMWRKISRKEGEELEFKNKGEGGSP